MYIHLWNKQATNFVLFTAHCSLEHQYFGQTPVSGSDGFILCLVTMSDVNNANDSNALCAGRYAENQDLVNKNSGMIKEQADIIAVLEERLKKQQGPVNSGSKSDKKRIKELEADVESLKVHAVTYYIVPLCSWCKLESAVVRCNVLCHAARCYAGFCHAVLLQCRALHAVP